MFTQNWAKVKGEAEGALKELGKTKPTLRPFSLRPGGVDSSGHKEIQSYLVTSMKLKILGSIFFPPSRLLIPSMMSPTRDLGRVLCELALGDGKPLEGQGISGEGRTLSNAAMRRLAGI